MASNSRLKGSSCLSPLICLGYRHVPLHLATGNFLTSVMAFRSIQSAQGKKENSGQRHTLPSTAKECTACWPTLSSSLPQTASQLRSDQQRHQTALNLVLMRHLSQHHDPLYKVRWPEQKRKTPRTCYPWGRIKMSNFATASPHSL